MPIPSSSVYVIPSGPGQLKVCPVHNTVHPPRQYNRGPIPTCPGSSAYGGYLALDKISEVDGESREGRQSFCGCFGTEKISNLFKRDEGRGKEPRGDESRY